MLITIASHWPSRLRSGESELEAWERFKSQCFGANQNDQDPLAL